MSNKAKSVIFKLLSFACCVVPPVIVMIQNGCFAPKNANAFQRLGIVGVALAIVIAIISLLQFKLMGVDVEY